MEKGKKERSRLIDLIEEYKALQVQRDRGFYGLSERLVVREINKVGIEITKEIVNQVKLGELEEELDPELLWYTIQMEIRKGEKVL